MNVSASTRTTACSCAGTVRISSRSASAFWLTASPAFPCSRGPDSTRANQWNRLTLVAPVDAKVFAIDRDDAVLRKQLAHENQTQIGQVRVAISVARGQSAQFCQMVVHLECDP